jgi:CRP-like cAMP-binding protein
MSQPQELSRSNVNRLLAALPAEDYERLRPSLTPVTSALGDVIYESQRAMDYVYSPTTSHVSLLYTMGNGATAEVGLVGNEGIVGIALFMGDDTTPNQAIVQGAGDAFKMSAAAMLVEFNRGGAFQIGLLRYTQSLIVKISQTAVCNRLHTTEQRLCRWILMTHDRSAGNEFRLTQEFISHMLGVRREQVTLAASTLQKQQLISYSRGQIRILDRAGLETVACTCYGAVKEEYDNFLQ